MSAFMAALCIGLSLVVAVPMDGAGWGFGFALGVGLWLLCMLAFPWVLMLRIDGRGAAVSWPTQWGRTWATIGLDDVVGFEVRRWAKPGARRAWSRVGLNGQIAVAVRLRDGSCAHVLPLTRPSGTRSRGVNVVAAIGRWYRGRRVRVGPNDLPLRWNAATDDAIVAFLTARLEAVRTAWARCPPGPSRCPNVIWDS